MFQLQGTAQCRVDMWKSCTVDAVVADGFALTGGFKVVRASLLCRKSSVALIVIGERSEHYNYTPRGQR